MYQDYLFKEASTSERVPTDVTANDVVAHGQRLAIAVILFITVIVTWLTDSVTLLQFVSVSLLSSRTIGSSISATAFSQD